MKTRLRLRNPTTSFLVTHKTRTKLHIAALKQGDTNQVTVRKEKSINENTKHNSTAYPPLFNLLATPLKEGKAFSSF
jgi:hypothetical protein